MNWLYFFMGVTAAWTFMGVGIFLFDLVSKPRKNTESEFQTELLRFWANADRMGQEKIIKLSQINESLRDISLTIHDK